MWCKFSTWLKSNKPGIYRSETGINSNKTKQKYKSFSKQLHYKLVKAFSKKSFEYNVQLNSIMTYGHIKEWLIEIGYNHWSELPHKYKALILHRNTSFPDWDETEVKPYSL